MTTPMTDPQVYRGQHLGLPESGSGSLAPTGVRLAAFVLDGVASALVAGLFVRAFRSSSGSSFVNNLPGSWSLIPLALDYLIGASVAGRTLGMYLFGLRLARVAPLGARVDPGRSVLRTVLLFLFVPPLVFDRDGRGLHDRFTDSAVVRA